MCTFIRKFGITFLILGYNIGCSFAYHILNSDIWEQPVIPADRSDVVMTRQLKSTNSTSDGGSSGSSPAFFDDPGNKAMYLVLPILVLIYGGCSSIYCVHKCRMYVKRRKAQKERERRRKQREALNDIMSENNDEQKIRKSNFRFEKSKTMYNIEVDKQQITQKVRPTSAMATITCALELARTTTPSEPDHHAITLDDLETPAANDVDENETKTTIIDKISDENDNVETNDLSEKQTKENIAPKEPKQELVREEITDIDDNESINKEQTIVADILESSEISTPHKDKKKLKLSFSDVAEILAYYGEKKHKPDVIPTKKENNLPAVKKTRKWKKKVFES